MPVTDDDLRSSAYRLSGGMSAMLRADGLDPHIIGIPDQQDADVFAETFQIDAELHMSMSPDRLGEEFDEIRKPRSPPWTTRTPTARSTHTLLAAHAVSMTYALSTQFRASCRDLMEKTADTYQAIAAEQPNPGLDWASIGISFAYHDHAHPEEYAPEVERERQRYAAEKAEPGGVISQRLTGEG